MGYTHFDKVSGNRVVAVGKKDEEVVVASADEPVLKTKVVKITHDTKDIDKGATILLAKPGQLLVSIAARVVEAWSSTTSDEVYVGYGSSLSEYINKKSVASTGLVDSSTAALPTAVFATDTAIKVKVDSKGTVGSTGVMEITLIYIDNIEH